MKMKKTEKEQTKTKNELVAYSEAEWLKIFPEIREVVPIKLRGLSADRKRLEQKIVHKIGLVNRFAGDEISRILYREGIKNRYVRRLCEIESEIWRFRYLSALINHRPIAKAQLREQVEQARKADIIEIASRFTILLKRGQYFTGCCPLHQETTPSFTIYPDTNSWYCFGCCQGGDVLTLIQRVLNCDFKDAVNYLCK